MERDPRIDCRLDGPLCALNVVGLIPSKAERSSSPSTLLDCRLRSRLLVRSASRGSCSKTVPSETSGPPVLETLRLMSAGRGLGSDHRGSPPFSALLRVAFINASPAAAAIVLAAAAFVASRSAASSSSILAGTVCRLGPNKGRRGRRAEAGRADFAAILAALSAACAARTKLENAVTIPTL